MLESVRSRASGNWIWVALASGPASALHVCPQVLLRVKENELQYLKKEVQCLRDELQVIQKVGGASSVGFSALPGRPSQGP